MAKAAEAAEVAAARAEGRAVPASGGAPVDDDDDIFGDVGRDFEITAKKDAAATAAAGATSYFGDKHAKGEASIAPPTAKPGKPPSAARAAQAASARAGDIGEEDIAEEAEARAAEADLKKSTGAPRAKVRAAQVDCVCVVYPGAL